MKYEDIRSDNVKLVLFADIFSDGHNINIFYIIFNTNSYENYILSIMHLFLVFFFFPYIYLCYNKYCIFGD